MNSHIITLAILMPLLAIWPRHSAGDTLEGYRGFGCGLLHRGNRSECWVVTRGDGVRPDELYQSSYGAVHAELLTRYERVGASRGTQVWCRDMEPFVIRFRTCRVSKLLRYQDGGASVNYLNKPMHYVSAKLSEGRLEFAKESSRNAMAVKCTNFPDFWVRKALVCKVANARPARIAGLSTREPLRRILNDLSAGRLVKVNRSAQYSIHVTCPGISSFWVQQISLVPPNP